MMIITDLQVVLLRKMLVVPLLACVFSSLSTEIAAWSQPSIVSQPPKKPGGPWGRKRDGAIVPLAICGKLGGGALSIYQYRGKVGFEGFQWFSCMNCI